jgi:hypothetical protein
MVSLLISNLAIAIEMFGWVIEPSNFSYKLWIAFQAIFQFFSIITVFGILMTASNVAIPRVDPKHNATYDPDAPEGHLHTRFTYTGPKVEEAPPPIYEIPTAYKYQVPQQWSRPASDVYTPSEMHGRQLYEVPQAHNHAYQRAEGRDGE